jgi:hypothetical protein
VEKGPFVKKGQCVIDPFFKGSLKNCPFFNGGLKNFPFLGSIYLTSQPRSIAHQHSLLFLDTKHTSKTFHHTSQIDPLIMEKGLICN